MDTKVVFDVIQTELSPNAYFRQLMKQFSFDQYHKVKPGEYVEFTRPPSKHVTFTFVGEMPEKYEIKKNKIRVLMPSCVLFLIVTGKKNGLMAVQMEVANAL